LPDDAERIDRDILIAELVRGMDSWTREVFEALESPSGMGETPRLQARETQFFGYSFDEIGRALGGNPQGWYALSSEPTDNRGDLSKVSGRAQLLNPETLMDTLEQRIDVRHRLV